MRRPVGEVVNKGEMWSPTRKDAESRNHYPTRDSRWGRPLGYTCARIDKLRQRGVVSPHHS
jgi:hypothetical protein